MSLKLRREVWVRTKDLGKPFAFGWYLAASMGELAQGESKWRRGELRTETQSLPMPRGLAEEKPQKETYGATRRWEKE